MKIEVDPEDEDNKMFDKLKKRNRKMGLISGVQAAKR